jgi:hypothetical protein
MQLLVFTTTRPNFNYFGALGPHKKTSRKGLFCRDENNKSGHNLKEKCHMLPSLDNEFELVARIMQKNKNLI